MFQQHHLLAILAFAFAPTTQSHPRNPSLASIHHGNRVTYLATLRGGSTDTIDQDEDRRKTLEAYDRLVKYRSEQQLLYQVRSTYLSEMLASRGVPLPTVVGVATVEGNKPAEKVDWDCAMSTVEEPKSCLYSFDAEPNTKVVAPVGTDQWISLSALNRLRRTDQAKVEPMWHSRYAILQSWFSDNSEYSILQHIGIKGFFISSVLLDGWNGMVLRLVLISAALSLLNLFMPALEYFVGRMLCCAPFWSQWQTWGRIARAGFPLKLLLGQLAWKGVVSAYSKVEGKVRDYFVDLECEILEESVPLTVGPDNEDNFDSEETEVEEEYDEY